jgi:3-hydroxyisobutyrate dehydrogenase-like beta-hydroxyacid dehydrogenase
MGAPLAMRLLRAGYDVHVYNRTREKAEPLGAGGAEVCDTPDQAIAAAEFIILMLADVRAIVRSVLTESAMPLLAGKTIIQMGTIAPAESKELAAEFARHDARYIEAPVLGSIPEAKKGKLQIMAGGEAETYAQCLPILEEFGDPKLVGPVGQGAAMKLAMNQMIAALTSGFALSLGLVRKEGVEVEQFMEVLRDSALYAPTFDKKLERMLDRDFKNPNFPLKHLDKDVKLFLSAASAHTLSLSGLKGIEQIIERGILEGLSELDYSALYEVVDREK